MERIVSIGGERVLLKGTVIEDSESPRDSRRLFGLSQATTSVF